MTPVDVANLALDGIGARFSIVSLTPPMPPPNAVAVARQYDLTFQGVARAAHWNCLRYQVKLTLLKAAKGTPENPDGTTLPTPPTPYQYEYAYPPDCLKARYILPQRPDDAASPTPVFGGGLLATPSWNVAQAGFPFAVAVDTDSDGNQIRVILTDLEYAQLVYTARVDNPDLWDPHFQRAVVASLGAWLVNPLARNAQVLQEQINIASTVIQQARISDGNEGTTSVDHTPDFLAVRGTTVNGYPFGPFVFAPWDAMAFPGVII